MNIPLNNFEVYINEDILARGIIYFGNGYVTNFTQLSDSEYEAIVEGTNEYTVRLKLENGLITQISCNCPYDMGPICKHEVAAMYYLRKYFNSTKPAKKKTLLEQANNILNKVSFKELKERKTKEARIVKDADDLELLAKKIRGELRKTTAATVATLKRVNPLETTVMAKSSQSPRPERQVSSAVFQ